MDLAQLEDRQIKLCDRLALGWAPAVQFGTAGISRCPAWDRTDSNELPVRHSGANEFKRPITWLARQEPFQAEHYWRHLLPRRRSDQELDLHRCWRYFPSEYSHFARCKWFRWSVFAHWWYMGPWLGTGRLPDWRWTARAVRHRDLWK